ncbi:helix-turn-helix domain-containing protein [Tritonibacter scottomollicae]|uniref:helix-turn-helix domain-containing protein n=1 Tax=Tritonibacter scottomollicae TaxID=483013 RepID=UPI00374D393A
MTVPLLNSKEAAEALGVCEKTLRECRLLGLRYVQVTRGAIRYRRDDLESYIEERTVEACRSDRRTANTTTTTSRSGVVDFMDRAERKTSKKPKRLNRRPE